MDEAEPRPPQPRLVGPPRRDPPAVARRQAARGQLRRRVRQLRPSALSVDVPDLGDAQAAPARPPDRVGNRLPPFDRPRVRRHHGRLPARRRPAPPRGLRVAARRRGGGAPRVVGTRPAPGRDEPLSKAGRRRPLPRRADAVAGRPVRQPRHAVRVVAPRRARRRHRRSRRRSPRGARPRCDHDRRRRGDRLPSRRPRGRGAPDDRRCRRTWLRRRPRRPCARAQRQDAPGQHLARQRGTRGDLPAADRRAAAADPGRGRRPRSARPVLPVRPLPAARVESTGDAAGQPPGDLERDVHPGVGQQVHDQHQCPDELLAGGGRRAVGVSRAVLRPPRPGSRRRCRHRPHPLRLPRVRRPPQHRPLGRHRSARQHAVRAVAARRGVDGAAPVGPLRLHARHRLPPHPRLPGDEGRGDLPPRLRLRARRAADDRPDHLTGERLPPRRRARGAVPEPGHGRADHAGAVRPVCRCRRRARARRSVARRGHGGAGQAAATGDRQRRAAARMERRGRRVGAGAPPPLPSVRRLPRRPADRRR